jgi:hypothetical protein
MWIMTLLGADVKSCFTATLYTSSGKSGDELLSEGGLSLLREFSVVSGEAAKRRSLVVTELIRRSSCYWIYTHKATATTHLG